jgi:3-deoxy-D-manno-octulosonic-acid transferase
MLRYGLLLRLASPLVLLYTLWQAARSRDPAYLPERFGRHAAGPVQFWLHAASVGEVNAARPLIGELRARHPEAAILVTTNTVTGAGVVRTLPEQVVHRYLPLDYPAAVARFLDATRPRCALMVETELWPNLYAACRRRAIPVVIVNARLSERTTRAPAFLRAGYREALGCVQAVLARSPTDAERYRALGAPPERVQVLGNIKFAARSGREVLAAALPRPYVLAASTREGEERLIAAMWAERPWRTDSLLVIAPRHPERAAEVLRELKPHFARIAVRSRGELPVPETEVYLVDTIGELAPFLAGAELVFMGGSLVPKKGGHNILEPALYGRAVLFGPHMENFAEEARLFREHEAGVQVRDAAELGRRLDELHADAAARARLGANARALMTRHADLARRYVDELERLCEL